MSLSNLRIKATFSKLPILPDNLFYRYQIKKIVNKFLIAGGKLMPETHLRN